jgi:hypothetical protein
MYPLLSADTRTNGTTCKGLKLCEASSVNIGPALILHNRTHVDLFRKNVVQTNDERAEWLEVATSALT